jgi:dienelactone hydrolase
MDQTRLVIAPDIFGVTPELQELAEEFAPLYAGITIVDPYGATWTGTRDEARAYAEFQARCTLGGYTRAIAETIACADQMGIELLGFSVGAAAVWPLSSGPWSQRIVKATCFYGSRIRDMLHIDPLCPVTLIFPRSEDHFDVQAVISSLSTKPSVTCIRTNFLHGFMNKRSRNFDRAGYGEYLRLLRQGTR